MTARPVVPRPYPHPYLAGTARPRIIAHRGFVSKELAERGVAENTREAFAAALAAGADYLESDCRLTSDGVVVLFHDDDLARVIGDPRRVDAVPYAELAALMAGRGGLLMLDEAFEVFPDARFNIDIKTPEVASAAGRILGRFADRALVNGFDDRNRTAAMRVATGVAIHTGMRPPAVGPGVATIRRVVIGVRTRSRWILSRALDGIDALQIPERYGRVRVLSPRLVRLAHAHGVEVHVWTVNDPQRMRELVELGVDGVITDRTDLAVEALAAARRQRKQA